MRMHALAVVLTSLTLIPGVRATIIAQDGQPAATIVVAEDATIAEQHAAAELAHYLGRIAGCEFTIADAADGPAIYVGPTVRAADAGIDVSALGNEEWMVRTVGDDLIVVGGRPRGTLYAAYHLLEGTNSASTGGTRGRKAFRACRRSS